VLYVVATRHQVIKGFKNISQIPVGASAKRSAYHYSVSIADYEV
jgi:hypothetical protein